MIRTAPTHAHTRSAELPEESEHPGSGDAARREIVAGLVAPNAWLSPKYFYDPLGSRLFEAITRLPEYYPTRTEQGIFADHATDIARSAGAGATLIDLGAGNCEKASRLFDTIRPAQYVAIDISADFLNEALNDLKRRFPSIDMLGVGMDFSASLVLPGSVRAGNRLFYYPGSSIGNFSPHEALAFVSDLRQQIATGNDNAAGGLLIGVDLVKDKAILEAAYDDSLGVTAAFNLNVLNHINALIGSDFSVSDWNHYAYFNETQFRIEMHLEAERDVIIHWPDGERHFHKSERIHTENSYKYRLPDFHALLRQAGFGNVRTWTDAHEWFAVCHATP